MRTGWCPILLSLLSLWGRRLACPQAREQARRLHHKTNQDTAAVPSGAALPEFAGFGVDLDFVADFDKGRDLQLVLCVFQDRRFGDLARSVAARHRLGVLDFASDRLGK